MPIDYQRDDRRRLLTVTLTDPFAFDALLDHVDRQWADHIWAYAVLYDGRTTTSVTPPHELQRLIERVRLVGGGVPRGPVGIVIPATANMLRGGMALTQRVDSPENLEVLLNAKQVDAWVGRNAPRLGPSSTP